MPGLDLPPDQQLAFVIAAVFITLGACGLLAAAMMTKRAVVASLKRRRAARAR
jgi:hypothetical protein